MKFNGNPWKAMKIYEIQRKIMKFSVNQLKTIEFNGNVWNSKKSMKCNEIQGKWKESYKIRWKQQD